MALGRDATARQPFSPAAPEIETSRRLELVSPRPVRRKRPVAILKIPRFWPALQLGRESTAAAVSDLRPGIPADGLDAFGSEADPRPAAPSVAIVLPKPAP